MEPEACNYHAAATDPGTCLFATGCDVCTGEVDGSGSVVDFDVNNNGVCDPLELPGCTYPEACNFDAAAGWDDGSCSFPSAGFDCAGACTLDTNGNGVCDLEEWEACETAAPSEDICGPGTFWDEAAGACMLLQCPGDFNGDQWIGTADLLELLARFEAPCGW
jgi:hypothetical protein